MSFYPIILMPIEVQRIMREMPPVPAFTQRLPRPPQREPQRIDNGKVTWEFVVLIVVAGILMQLFKNVYLGLPVLILGTMGIFLQIRLQVSSYPARLREYTARMEGYLKQLTDFSVKESQYQQAIALSRLPDRLAEFRLPLLKQFLSRQPEVEVVTPQPADDKTKVKAKFGSILQNHFANKIHTNLLPKVKGFEAGYSPDFIYADQALNLHIAVEIDEPYNSYSKQPLHSRDNWTDYQNNQLLLKCGWLVVRFSEEQAITSPLSCCKTISQLIDDLLVDSNLSLQFVDVPELKPVRQWTEQEARQLAASNYRQTYQTFET